MSKYTCCYKSAGAEIRADYSADSLPGAMALHNVTRPEHASSVLRWIGPTGITFLMHDSKLKAEA